MVVLNWSRLHYTSRAGLQELLERHKEIFEEKLGTLKGFEAHICVDSTATPRIGRARSVPYAMRKKVDEELGRLVTEGVLVPVEFSEWAAPIVVVLKSDQKRVRLCGDFKMTINPVSKLDRYPIPKVEDLFASLKGGSPRLT